MPVRAEGENIIKSCDKKHIQACKLSFTIALKNITLKNKRGLYSLCCILCSILWYRFNQIDYMEASILDSSKVHIEHIDKSILSSPLHTLVPVKAPAHEQVICGGEHCSYDNP